MKRREFLKKVAAGAVIAALPVTILAHTPDCGLEKAKGAWQHYVVECEDGTLSCWISGAQIAEVSYSNRALSEDEMNLLYNSGEGTNYGKLFGEILEQKE